ncbi:MAG: ABC transporter ATP-binding protein [Deltaproteobacteria bacterium]
MDNREAVSIVRVEHLEKKYGTVHAVKGISFDIKEGEFYTLLGPSGCGKTTTLRCLAGLERADGGEVFIKDRLVDNGRLFVPPYQRPIGMVFQSYAIWPHMTVAGNVAFPLKNERKYSAKEIDRRVTEALDLVQLTGLGNRPAPNLSGGQQQRLALARALVATPAVLLLDEPLSNLDAKLREEMRLEIKNLTRRLGITTFYVTHDQLEALVLSDRIALMRDGKIIEEGNQYDMYMVPRYTFTADFFGVNNILSGTVIQADNKGKIAKLDLSLDAPIFAQIRDIPVEPHQNVQVAIRPENISFENIHSMLGAPDQRPEEINILKGVVKEIVFLGDTIDYRIAVKEKLLRVRAHPEMLFKENETVTMTFTPKHVCLLQPL